MNLIKVEIYEKGLTYRKGNLYVNGKLRMKTLEPADSYLYQENGLNFIKTAKSYGKCAIPYGTYQVKMIHSNKFNRQIPHLLNVPGFLGIEMHTGNSSVDTEGCLLVGMSDKKGLDWINYSRTAFQALIDIINEISDNDLWINIAESAELKKKSNLVV